MDKRFGPVAGYVVGRMAILGVSTDDTDRWRWKTDGGRTKSWPNENQSIRRSPRVITSGRRSSTAVGRRATSRIIGRPVQVINEIINGRKAITARTARELEAALGPSAESWMNLETSYQLYKEGQADPEIRSRAREFGSAARGREVQPVEGKRT